MHGDENNHGRSVEPEAAAFDEAFVVAVKGGDDGPQLLEKLFCALDKFRRNGFAF